MAVNSLLVAVPNVFRNFWRRLSIVPCLLLGVLLSTQDAVGESSIDSVEVKSIEAMLIDRATGELSDDILEADSTIFKSTGKIAGRHPTADDVLLRVKFTAKHDGVGQPPTTIAVLQHIDALEGPFVKVAHWESVFFDRSHADTSQQAVITVLLKDVTCSRLDIVVNIYNGEDSGNNVTAVLPFECKE